MSPNSCLLSNQCDLSHFQLAHLKGGGSPLNLTWDAPHPNPLPTHAKPHCDIARAAIPYIYRPCVDDVVGLLDQFSIFLLYGTVWYSMLGLDKVKYR